MEQKLYLDPVKVRAWLALAAVIFLLLLLGGIPKYYNWLRREAARTDVEIRQILKEGK
jgi:hypothetical protein